MIRPDALTRNEPLLWSTGTGTDVWDMFRNNVRMSQLVEMDLRGLVAGCHFASERVEVVVRTAGEEPFVESLRAIRDLTEAEMRRRITAIEDGVYRATSWTEFALSTREVLHNGKWLT